MPDIVLATVNARWIHSAFGVRSLLANLGDLRDGAVLEELTAGEDPAVMVGRLLAHGPQIVGLGVYLWNVTAITEVVSRLRRTAPEVRIVLGGPEVSYPPDLPPVAHRADVVITGEAEHAFPAVCRALLEGEAVPSVVAADEVEPATLVLPYGLYDDEDIAHRVLYVESSRGCPYRCSFCLSANDARVRRFPRDRVLAALDELYARGARRFKFVDRALHLGWGRDLLRWLLDRLDDQGGHGVFAHFELVPDHLPEDLRDLLSAFPPGALQLEAGVQTLDPAVGARIERRQDEPRLREALTFLREHTQVHLHADLVAGLPGETLDGFGAGFDALHALGPQEIQVGILKRLRGAPIASLGAPWDLAFHPEPPYEVVSTSCLDTETLERLKHFSRLWDRLANRGHLPTALPRLWSQGGSPFHAFLGLTDRIRDQHGRTHGLPLKQLVEDLFHHLVEDRGEAAEEAGRALAADYLRVARKDIPRCLRRYAPPRDQRPHADPSPRGATPERQRRHLH